jgi:hypothetical protein
MPLSSCNVNQFMGHSVPRTEPTRCAILKHGRIRPAKMSNLRLDWP